MAKKLSHALRLLEVAKKIAEGVGKHEFVRGCPIPETYVSPFTGLVEENGITVNMRLINELREILKELDK